jgi:hypothetical protein
MGKSFRRSRDDWDDYQTKASKFKNRRTEKKKKNKIKTVTEDDKSFHSYEMED